VPSTSTAGRKKANHSSGNEPPPLLSPSFSDSPPNNLQVSGKRERKRKFDPEFVSTEDHVKRMRSKSSSGTRRNASLTKSAAAQRLSVSRLDDDLQAESSSLDSLKMKPRKKKSKSTFPRRNAPKKRKSNKPDSSSKYWPKISVYVDAQCGYKLYEVFSVFFSHRSFT
jgi:hypothetical protein